MAGVVEHKLPGYARKTAQTAQTAQENTSLINSEQAREVPYD